ncbi:MAG: hypothetical protein ACRDNS_16285 [Trebonia sp.]
MASAPIAWRLAAVSGLIEETSHAKSIVVDVPGWPGQIAGQRGAIVQYTFTRSAPPGWSGFAGRLDAEMLATIGPEAARRPRTFICGRTAFVESAASLLVELGHQPEAIRTERFGPTG